MNKITICACSSRPFIDKAKVAQLAAEAQKLGYEVELVSDLCELCEDKDAKVHAIAQTALVACYERAVKSLMAFAGEDNVKCLDLRSQTVEEVMQALAGMGGASPKAGDSGQKNEGNANEELQMWQQQIEAMPCKLGDDAWYPTLDKDQCAECGKCLEFCPFGVYEMVDDRIRVVHPHNCKNNCPACARTCPASAIIFPKYDRSPINGGKEKQENAIKLDTAFDFRQNTKELYGQALRERLASRRVSILRDK